MHSTCGEPSAKGCPELAAKDAAAGTTGVALARQGQLAVLGPSRGPYCGGSALGFSRSGQPRQELSACPDGVFDELQGLRD